MKMKIIRPLVALTILCVATTFAVAGTFIRFPSVALEKGERIVRMEVKFRGAEIRSITNIPRDWDIHLHLESQFTPTVSGGCGHGASALENAEELPVFEVEPFESSEKQITGDATLYVVKDFESGKGREVKIKIKANRP